MKFQFIFGERTVEVWFTSSKERFQLGELTFVDTDGDQRLDVMSLLQVVLQTVNSPMLAGPKEPVRMFSR